jgi:hypothetical protein
MDCSNPTTLPRSAFCKALCAELLAFHKTDFLFHLLQKNPSSDCFSTMTVFNINEEDNISRMRRGDLYYAFTPQLVAARKRCKRAVTRLNAAEDPTRREMAELWRE